MPEPDEYTEQAIRETAYFIWEREGRPERCARDHGNALLSRSPAATYGAVTMSFCRMKKRSWPGDQMRTCPRC